MNLRVDDVSIDSKELVKKLLQIRSLPKLKEIEVEGYEKVVHITDPAVGLNAIIALHDLTMGPALGGVRILPYENFDVALNDVLRLSRGMTYKSAVAQVGFGGGKSVIIADPKTQKTAPLLYQFGRAVEMLNGSYICAEDVGCTTSDVKTIRHATRYVVGLPLKDSSGDPGPFTAWGVFRGIQATLKKIYRNDDCEGRTIAIQGLGNVGMNLAQYLFWAGADLIVSDIDAAKTELAKSKFGARVVDEGQILRVGCDIFSPCALGAVINEKTIGSLQCKGVAGAANNVLEKEEDGERLMKKKILYAPDFVINAGGLLNVAAELEADGYLPTFSRAKIHRIYDTLSAIYEIADKNRISTQKAALALVDYRLKYKIGKRVIPCIFHHAPE